MPPVGYLCRASCKLRSTIDELGSDPLRSMRMKTSNLADLAHALFEEAGDALFLFDPDSEQLLDVNPMAVRLTGFSREELLRVPIAALYTHESDSGEGRIRQASQQTGIFHAQDGFLLRSA